MEKHCFPANESVYSETIEETLQDLCVASFVPNYCTFCTSGSGCCTMSHDDPIIDERRLFDDVNRLPMMEGFLSPLATETVPLATETVPLATETVHGSTSNNYTSLCSSKIRSINSVDETYIDKASEECYQVYDVREDVSNSNDDCRHQSEEDQTKQYSEEDVHLGLHEQTTPRRRVTIDLSQKDDLSETEIMQILLASTEGMTLDEPFEVILEIDNEAGNNRFWNHQPKTFETLREELRNSGFFTSSPKILLAKHPEIKTLPPQLEEKNHCKKTVTHPQNKNLPSIYEQSLRREVLEPQVIYSTPSYQKATILINEIENCFTETANIVDKTLGSAEIFHRSPSAANKEMTARFVSSKEKLLVVGDENHLISKTIDSLSSDQKTHKHNEDEPLYNNTLDSDKAQHSLMRPQESEKSDKRDQCSIVAVNGLKDYKKSKYLEAAYGDEYYQESEYVSCNLDNEPIRYTSNGSTIHLDSFSNNSSDNEYSVSHLVDDSNIYSDEGIMYGYLNDKFISDADSESKYNTNNLSNAHSFDEQKEHSTMSYFHSSHGNYQNDSDKPLHYNITECDDSHLEDDVNGIKKSFLSHENDSQLFWRKWESSFDKDIDELFRECYEINSTEPSTTLGSCLKNLENLSSQLKLAKENILKEVICYDNDFGNCTSMGQVSIENQKKLAIINELIETKLKNKLRLEKFHVGPPTMGLEGRIHKVIAKVPPIQTFSENGYPHAKENDSIMSFLMNNNNINIKRTFHNNIIENLMLNDSDLLDSAFETNSEISNTTNSNSFVSVSQMETNSCIELDGTTSKDSGSYLTDEGFQSILSYEETLALYEDNQELQQSLLSILHSLNDIHDNFLSRRQKEVDLSQQSSRAIHDDIKANMAGKIFDVNSQQGGSTSSSQYFPIQDLSMEAIADDFNAIRKIIRVSDELKNLGLFPYDLRGSRRHKPSRSLSLNRFSKPKRYNRTSFNYNSEEEYTEAKNDLAHQSDKCYSMPNLNFDKSSLEEDLFRDPLQILQPNSSFVENFTKQIKYKNANCYEVTLNFLKRIIEACKLLDGDGGPAPMRETMIKSFSDLQEHYHQDHTQNLQNKVNMRTY